MSDLDLFYVHTATVKPWTGQSGHGPVYGPPVTMPCFIDDSLHLVRNAEGEEVVSSTVLYTDTAYASDFPVNSEVTANGRVSHVITLNSHDSRTLGLPDHVEVHLT